MSQYLLLRDNKQSGPYSVDELVKLGLKPYDLVWLDGKSAAWRYPSEIDELKQFAPATTSHAPTPVTSKKIYVTLPAGTGSRHHTVKEEQSQAQTTGQESHAALNEKFARLRDEKIKQAEEMAANPAIAPKVITSPTPMAVAGFSEIVKQHHPQQQETLASVHLHRNSSSKLLMRSIVAACLVLGGIIIGLAISNSRQQKNQAALDQLVKQIQERERRNQLAIKTVAPSTPNTAHNSQATTSQQPETVAAPPAEQQETATRPAGANTAKPAPALKEAQPLQTEQPASVKIIPAVVTNKPAANTVDRQEIEKARRNIHQLVAVDANKYKTGVLGGISGLKLTISNNSLYPLDEVEVEVRYLGPEKRVVKTQVLRFNDVAAGEQKTIEAPRSNRGVTIDYAITGINSKALGLAHTQY